MSLKLTRAISPHLIKLMEWHSGSYYSRSSRKRTPSGRDKNVRNWSWPLTRMILFRVSAYGSVKTKKKSKS